MKRIYILILSAVLLSSCDFFYKTIEYKGEIEQEQLVLTANLEAGKTPRIFLNSSKFFADAKQEPIPSASTPNSDSAYWTGVQRNWVTDAVVEMQINNGEWQMLTCVPDTIFYYNDNNYTLWNQLAYSYRNDYVFQPGDSVRIRASHPNFPNQAAAAQLIPHFAGSEVYNKKFSKAKWNINFFECDVFMPPYMGSEGTILNFVEYAYWRNHITSIYAGYDENSQPVYKDTLYDEYGITSYIYSRGLGFEKYENVNCSVSSGYWGARSNGLYHNVNTYGTEVSFPIKACYHPYTNNENRSYTITDSIVVEVKVVSQDYYRNVASMFAGDYYYNSVPDFWQSDSDSEFEDMTDIIEEIQDAFNELGNLEGIQVFSNVIGGFGHVTASATERIVVVPENF